MSRSNAAAARVLAIGLHPNQLDYSALPGIDETTFTARVLAGQEALRDAGFDVVHCMIAADPDAAEAQVRAACAGNAFGVAMIGAGVRAIPEHTLLFERLVNLVFDLQPGVRFCFNTSPETTIDALRRWIAPGLDERLAD